MAKKQKSKSRLDKYYYLAKDHGFRSRATFKLIQLNKKYNFFANSTVCIDLCAAPGGWLQAATKLMPVSSIKVGVDLVPIKAIPGCSTIVSDITTQECRSKLEKEIKHMKADIVLNDGAPNVGGNWTQDAYSQSELVLFAVKLASEFLKVGGWFITKVFRSSDYSSLMYVMQQLFRKVEATKPLASRQVSAEIFVVCQGFKGGDIDPKLTDPKYALKQIEDEEDMKRNSIQSIKSLLDVQSQRHRSGYYGDSLFKSKEFYEFIEEANPYQFLYEVNKITIKDEKSKTYLEAAKKPADYEALFSDLKVLGKTELTHLILWRDKIRVKCIKKKPKIQKTDKEDLNEIEPESYTEKKMKEMDDEIKKLEKQKKKKTELQEKKKEKNELRQKISFLKENDQFANDGTEFDPQLFKYLKDNNINIEDLDNKIENNEDESDSSLANPVNEIDLSELDEEDYYAMMNETVEENIKMYNNEKDDLAAKRLEQKLNKEKFKKKKNFEDDVSDLEEGAMKVEKEYNSDEEDENDKEKDKVKDKDSDEDSDDILYDVNSDDEEANDDQEEEEYEGNSEEEEKIMKELKKTMKPEHKKENDKPSFVNPLKAVNNKQIKDKTKGNSLALKEEESNNKKPNQKKIEADEENNQDVDSDTEKPKKDSQFLNKKRKREEEKNHQEIEYVAKEENDSEYDSDEIAEIRAIAKKMLRKKDRINILDKSYNRYAFDDIDFAPDWFVDDEKQHNKAAKPVTKDEIAAEKELLRQANDRMPKKVLEAQNRKRKRLQRQMDKVKRKAQIISNQDEMGEGSKIRQIEKLYKKELNKNKETKKYVVVRSNTKVGRDSKNVRYVDKRLKKDKRAMKRAEKKHKSSNFGDKGGRRGKQSNGTGGKDGGKSKFGSKKDKFNKNKKPKGVLNKKKR